MTRRETVAKWLEKPATGNFVIGVIILNAIVLGMETSDELYEAIGGVLMTIDLLCLGVFIIEIALKLYAYGLRFFRNGWNVFDFIIVGIALLPGAHSLSVLRALRILRVLRVISAAPRLRRVVEGFIRAVPGMASVFLMMAMIFYIGAVMATNLFADSFPDWFGTIGRSAYSLFQIMTLESWSMGIVRPVMELYQYAWAFFVPFIIITSFAVVNLLVGLIVNSMQDAHDAETEGATGAYRDEVLRRLEAIEARIEAAQREK
ncbi:ion transporter [Marinibacterium profundimaris]|uniref:Voltage-gated sodium channel n=1 Tax=Marinibacterium profundimaris TaxID=1679460 RepID=A0A225NMT7_9RHOB|nr:ion transporter [Marinibacterium profundimaris]OWU75765.1 voltage-gated sodium channel [Marinibacterium profundimaris]